MDKIQIVSWLLTRRCNLACDYCRIARDYKTRPKNDYPSLGHYFKMEMSTDYVLECLGRLHAHNPNCFHILYGGEPLLRKDLPEIVNYCNDNDINYTIITNNSDEVQPMLERLIGETNYITGLTSSIDPIIFSAEEESDRVKKSIKGLERLKKYRECIKDIVAEITVDSKTVGYLYQLVDELSKLGISSDITVIDIAKSSYYDFAHITDPHLLVQKDDVLLDAFNRIIDNKLDVHMASVLLPEIVNILPAELDCKIEKDVHNLTIDADGSVRLCLRIRGKSTPAIKAINYISEDGRLNPVLKKMLTKDKKKFCRKCNWTCMIMSKLLSKNPNLFDDLVHKERREDGKEGVSKINAPTRFGD